jgi:ankyrin repeat protein
VYPIHVAVTHNRVLTLGWLLQYGVDVGVITSDGSTCLHLAVRNMIKKPCAQVKEIINILVPKHDIMNIEDANGFTVLDLAIDAGLDDIADLLSKAGAKENSSSEMLRTHITEAIEADDGPALQKLLNNSRNAHLRLRLPNGKNLLHWAVTKKAFNAVQAILQHLDTSTIFRVDSPYAGGWTSLHLAVELGSVEISSLLIQYGADVEASSDDGCGWAKVDESMAFGSVNSVTFKSSESETNVRGGGWTPLQQTTR